LPFGKTILVAFRQMDWDVRWGMKLEKSVSEMLEWKSGREKLVPGLWLHPWRWRQRNRKKNIKRCRIDGIGYLFNRKIKIRRSVSGEKGIKFEERWWFLFKTVNLRYLWTSIYTNCRQVWPHLTNL
jgi:hypothetical protein